MKRRKDQQNIKTFIDEDVRIKGEISSRGSLRLDGTLDGQLDVKGELHLGPTGLIKGEARAENAYISGKIEGNIYANGKVVLNNSGQIYGDVECGVINIAEGGLMEGKTSMSKNKSTTEPAADKNNNKQAKANKA
ncbi:MAG TPA: polymer-forming cytoskeletal protein [Syntrophomonadaceae bacterium]|nr:polymer-forming cytoskeletal protein [Syntrophomonadaceae bacterium]